MPETAVRLILASQSPRRRELLSQLPWHFTIQVANIDETPLAGEPPAEHVLRLATEKARAVALPLDPAVMVLGADTIVVIEGQILGKPADRSAAGEMLAELSGKTHQVMTAVAVCIGRTCHTRLVSTDVTFRAMTAEDIRGYVATGEPDDKAGAYGIQGLGGRFVERIEGSYSSVVGLPLVETEQLIRQCLIEPRDMQ